jgi:hypothetical protein
MRITFSLIGLMITSICFGQEWQVEIMPAFSGYYGDLTQKLVNLNEYRPAINLNILYHTGNFVDFRGGIAYGRITANDKYNVSPSIIARNLNFTSDIYEANLMLQFNIADPEFFTSYPYAFIGLGVFHFNPFTRDSTGKKVYLQPLGTEGEGLPQYPGRKMYSLYQLCLPMGAGWKWRLNDNWDMAVEFGFRFTFTDYLDDVSTTYPDPAILAAARGSLAAELSYRGTGNVVVGGQRGNPNNKNDSYFFGGIKFTTSMTHLFHQNQRSEH